MQIETPGLFEVADEWTLIAVMLAPPADDLPERVRLASANVIDPELLTAADAVLRSSTKSAYEHLFGRTGEIALHERSYRPPVRHEGLMLDLELVYARYGFEVGSSPADSIVTMAAFLGAVIRKEAFARIRRQRREKHSFGLASRHLLDVHFPGFVDVLADKFFVTEAPWLIHLGHALMSRSGPAVIESLTRRGQPLPVTVTTLHSSFHSGRGGIDGSD